jgi:hypothetical protein
VEFYSQDSADALEDYFKGELPSNGWTESLSTEADGAKFINFSSGENSESNVTVTITASPTEGYQVVTVSVLGGE